MAGNKINNVIYIKWEKSVKAVLKYFLFKSTGSYYKDFMDLVFLM